MASAHRFNVAVAAPRRLPKSIRFNRGAHSINTRSNRSPLKRYRGAATLRSMYL
jgi:hypothetical protein